MTNTIHSLKIHLVLALSVLAGCTVNTATSVDQEGIAKAKKRVLVTSNPNIHMSHVIELFVWDGDYPTRPMVVAAQEYFEPFRNHPAVVFSDSLLINELFYFDELTEILLYLEELPSTNFKYSLANSPYRDRLPVIEKWISLLAKFYRDADVGTFLQENEGFYLGANKEVSENLPPDDFVEQMESYYRGSRLSYTIIPAPEMPTGGAYGQRGIGPYVYTDNGLHIYQVISASLPVEKDSLANDYTYFGFDNRPFILRNSYHEFGHAFVNPILGIEQYENLVYDYEDSFTPSLKEIMLKQNYDNWFDCVAEHLVRLGEIRLAERSGNAQWAERLRKYHTDTLGFVFLPALEEKILQYEKNPGINSFAEYLPTLLTVFGED